MNLVWRHIMPYGAHPDASDRNKLLRIAA